MDQLLPIKSGRVSKSGFYFHIILHWETCVSSACGQTEIFYKYDFRSKATSITLFLWEYMGSNHVNEG